MKNLFRYPAKPELGNDEKINSAILHLWCIEKTIYFYKLSIFISILSIIICACGITLNIKKTHKKKQATEIIALKTKLSQPVRQEQK